MRAQIRLIRVGGLIALATVLMLLPAVGLAQDGGDDVDDEASSYCNSPVAQYLVEELGFDCELMAVGGVGLGEIMKAWHLSQTIPGFEDDWESLLMLKKEGLGWGQVKMAARLGNGDPEMIEKYLTLRESDVGWGQINHAQALADAEILDFDEALDKFQNGMGWDEIKAELGLEGPPPWVGGKNKADKGPPVGAAGGKNKSHGPPPWAQHGKDDDNDQ
ncbi:MAG: hypothetical protein WA996_24530 [Candidatus Promineifilaceae bacterium]